MLVQQTTMPNMAYTCTNQIQTYTSSAFISLNISPNWVCSPVPVTKPQNTKLIKCCDQLKHKCRGPVGRPCTSLLLEYRYPKSIKLFSIFEIYFRDFIEALLCAQSSKITNLSYPNLALPTTHKRSHERHILLFCDTAICYSFRNA